MGDSGYILKFSVTEGNWCLLLRGNQGAGVEQDLRIIPPEGMSCHRGRVLSKDFQFLSVIS